MYDLRLLNGMIYLDGSLVFKNIYIKRGKIAEITDAVLPASDSLECTGKNIFPGFIDPHVHFDLDLGEFKSADDFESGSKLAALGGFTTIIDFLDPILDNSEYKEMYHKRLKLAENSHIDYGFHCTLGNYLDDPKVLYEMLEKDGISSIKVFTTYSESNRRCSYNIIEKLLESKFTVLSHSEEDALVCNDYEDVKTFEASRPESAEIMAILKLVKLLNKTTGKLYIVHVSSGNTILKIKEDNKDLLFNRLFLESCPQYFYLDKSVFSQSDGRKYLLAPPLRSKRTREILHKNIDSIYTIGTDHCPFMLEEKYRYENASKVPKGVGGIEYSFLLMYEMFGLKVVDKFTKNPATILGIKNKGEIKVGFFADLCVYNPKEVTKVKSGHSKSDYSIYDDMIIQGKIDSTINRGEFVVKNGHFVGGKGSYIRRSI